MPPEKPYQEYIDLPWSTRSVRSSILSSVGEEAERANQHSHFYYGCRIVIGQKGDRLNKQIKTSGPFSIWQSVLYLGNMLQAVEEAVITFITITDKTGVVTLLGWWFF